MPFVPETKFREVWLRCLFLAWERIVIKRDNLALTAEVENLKQRTAKSSDSIWQMKKADLMEVARKELGMSLKDANADTVDILREKIQRVRALKDSLDDPQAATPPGLGKMKLAELRDEILNRGLEVDPNETRVQLQMRIRDDADVRIMQSTLATSTTDEDYEMIPAQVAKAKSTPKMKASFPSRR